MEGGVWLTVPASRSCRASTSKSNGSSLYEASRSEVDGTSYERARGVKYLRHDLKLWMVSYWA